MEPVLASWHLRRGVLTASVCLAVVGCAAHAKVSPTGNEEPEPVQGSNLAGYNLAGVNLAGFNLAGLNLGGANLGGNNLAGNNLAGNNLGGTNLGGNNLAGNNLASTNLAGVNLAGFNLAGNNLAGFNLGGSNLSGSNVSGTNLAGNNIATTNLAGNNLAGNNSGYNIHSLSGEMAMLYSGEDRTMPKTGQCIVLGIGSTAFAKLLGQQSTGAKISVAVGKLPWGFAKTKGGAVTLTAWEAIAWGDKTYCSFVLAAPSDAKWSGVAGFVKAIFRWNAPTTQSMDISSIDASAEYDSSISTTVTSYPGMMNAGGQFRSGKVNEKNFVAGELAFATATTNNTSVKVDFASWVTDVNHAGLILGNVQSSSPPTYMESVYYAIDNGDGTVSMRMYFPTQIGNLISSNLDLDGAYKAFLLGNSAEPAPRRCGGALWINFYYGDPIPSGKCDAGISWFSSETIVGTKSWSTVSGTTAPMNQYMVMPVDGNHAYQRGPNGGVLKTVLSETYVHMWERNYDVAGSSVTCKPFYASSNCPLYVVGTQVSRNGHNYTCANSNCANCGSNTSCAPGASGCPWGAVWTDNGSCL
jgi:hypothetical protein